MRHGACIPCHSAQPAGEKQVQTVANWRYREESGKNKAFAVETILGSGTDQSVVTHHLFPVLSSASGSAEGSML